MPNPHESAARLRKATAIADILIARGFTMEHVSKMQPHHWHIVAMAARVNPPSEETVKMVIERLDQSRTSS